MGVDEKGHTLHSGLQLGDARRWHHVQMEIHQQISLKLVSDNWFPINFN